MVNTYELAARSNKVDKLIAALDAEFGCATTERHMQDDAAKGAYVTAAAIRRTGINPPSQLTMDLLVVRIRERGKIAAQ